MSYLFPVAAVLATSLVAAAPAVAAPTWSAPSTVTTFDEANAPSGSVEVQVVPDRAGALTAVWAERIGTEQFVKFATRPQGGTWSAPQTISQLPPLTAAYGLQLVVASSGHAVLGWTARGAASTMPRTQFATRTPGGVWSAAADLEPPLAKPNSVGTMAFAITVGPSGELYASWDRALKLSPEYYVLEREIPLVRRAPGATTWTTETPLSAGAPAVPTFDDAGNAIAVVQENSGLYASSRPAGGTWSPRTVLAPPAFPSVSGVVHAVNGAGDAVAAWTQVVNSSDDTFRMYAAYRPRGGQWSAPKTLADTRLIGSSSATTPSLALDARGRATIAWREDTASGETVTSVLRTATSDAAGAWAPSVAIPSPAPTAPGETALTLGPPRLAAGPGGQAFVTASSPSGAYVSERLADGTWAVPTPLPKPEFSTLASAFVGTDGVASVAWKTPGSVELISAALPAPTAPPEPAKAPVVKVGVTLQTFFGRCPAKVQAYTVAGPRTLPTTLVGKRCTVAGEVALPKGTRLGSQTPVLVIGNGVMPYLFVGRVTAATQG